jgi:hypothetical protein
VAGTERHTDVTNGSVKGGWFGVRNRRVTCHLGDDERGGVRETRMSKEVRGT